MCDRFGSHLAILTGDLRERELHEEKLKKERRRPDYKFKKKASRSKGNRGQWKETGEGDGSGFAVGKRGGILRVPAQQ